MPQTVSTKELDLYIKLFTAESCNLVNNNFTTYISRHVFFFWQTDLPQRKKAQTTVLNIILTIILDSPFLAIYIYIA